MKSSLVMHPREEAECAACGWDITVEERKYYWGDMCLCGACAMEVEDGKRTEQLPPGGGDLQVEGRARARARGDAVRCQSGDRTTR